MTTMTARPTPASPMSESIRPPLVHDDNNWEIDLSIRLRRRQASRSCSAASSLYSSASGAGFGRAGSATSGSSQIPREKSKFNARLQPPPLQSILLEDMSGGRRAAAKARAVEQQIPMRIFIHEAVFKAKYWLCSPNDGTRWRGVKAARQFSMDPTDAVHKVSITSVLLC